jgi:hypothetical protein
MLVVCHALAVRGNGHNTKLLDLTEASARIRALIAAPGVSESRQREVADTARHGQHACSGAEFDGHRVEREAVHSSHMRRTRSRSSQNRRGPVWWTPGPYRPSLPLMT